MSDNNTTSNSEEATWTETIEVKGNQLVEQVQQLYGEASVRRVIIRKPDDEVLIEIPLAAGIAVGALSLFAPVLAAVGAMAALVAQFKIEIVRDVAESGAEEEVQHINVEAADSDSDSA